MLAGANGDINSGKPSRTWLYAMKRIDTNTDAVGLLLSGGLDSGILLGHLLETGRRVQPFYVRCQLLWEEAELSAAQSFLASMPAYRPEPLIVMAMPLADLYGEHWSINGQNTPEAGTPDDAVYLPGRNALLAVKPALWCAMHGIKELALGVLAANPFADATKEFCRDFETAITRATGTRIKLVRPFAHLEKKDIMELGRSLPLELTFSCIAPVGNLHCGRCNKCAERQDAFLAVGVSDPTRYAAYPFPRQGAM